MAFILGFDCTDLHYNIIRNPFWVDRCRLIIDSWVDNDCFMMPIIGKLIQRGVPQGT
jgi:hypothetical protein